MTNLAHLQDLFRHFSTLLDVMFLPQGSTTLLNVFDGDEILPLEGSAARLLDCSASYTGKFQMLVQRSQAWESSRSQCASWGHNGQQKTLQNTSRDANQHTFQSVFVNFIVPLLEKWLVMPSLPFQKPNTPRNLTNVAGWLRVQFLVRDFDSIGQSQWNSLVSRVTGIQAWQDTMQINCKLKVPYAVWMRDKNLQSLHAGQGVDDVIHLIVSMEEPDSLLLTQDRQNYGKWRVQETHSF